MFPIARRFRDRRRFGTLSGRAVVVRVTAHTVLTQALRDLAHMLPPELLAIAGFGDRIRWNNAACRLAQHL